MAFCLFKYFPYGGLQRDFLRIALKVQEKGYRIRVYTLTWQGDLPPGFELVPVPVTSLTNHSRYRKFHLWVQRHLTQNPADKVVGFNKMPDLDIYYAADSCYEDKARTQRNWLYRATPRYKLFSHFEAAVFGRQAATEILMISPVLTQVFESYYRTQSERFHSQPPGIARDRIAPPNREEIRTDFRREFGLADTDNLLLLIGSGFVTKGLDRALAALAALPPAVAERTRLFAIGQDSPNAFARLAARLGLKERVAIMKGRDDIPRFLLGADLLVHPAYIETTGTVLLEAVVSGLPVLATDVCGYARYVQEAGAGQLIPSPFQQETMNAMLASMLDSEERSRWSQNGMAYAQVADIYDMPAKVADFIAAMPPRTQVARA
ncbi:MAG: glycosyltransferase family 4 protein [Pseudomonadales bacterium]